MLGLAFDSGGVRVARLAESLALIVPLLAGQTASASGPYYGAAGAEVSPGPVQRPRPPILVAGSGRRLLSLAARWADIVALGVAPTESEAGAARRIGWLREAAPERFDELELNLNLMAVGDLVPRWIATQMGLTAAALAEAGAVSAAVGTVDQMCETLLRRREALGISYVVVGDELMEAFAPVVERLAGR
jgi:alkanesulfonate monooxygenase SsuD/methylene tetrahydromethanopterin reductase-like flavin-dependent oxidoreductase (luciferase family)